MKLIKWVMFLMIVAIGGSWYYGSKLPAETEAASSIFVVSAADSAWRIVRNTTPGTFTTGSPGIRLVATVEQPDRRGWTGRLIYTFVQSGGSTEITLTQRGEVRHPVYRALYNFWGPHRSIDVYLRELANDLGEPQMPRRAQPKR